MARMPADLLQFCRDIATKQQPNSLLGESNVEKLFLYTESSVLGYYHEPPKLASAHSVIKFDAVQELHEHADIYPDNQSPLITYPNPSAIHFLLQCQQYWQTQLANHHSTGLIYKISKTHYYLGLQLIEDKHYAPAVEHFNLALTTLAKVPNDAQVVYAGVKQEYQHALTQACAQLDAKKNVRLPALMQNKTLQLFDKPRDDQYAKSTNTIESISLDQQLPALKK